MRLSWFQITENSCRVSDNSGTKLPHDGSHRPFATNHSRDTNPLSLGQGIALGQTYHQFHLVWITNMKNEVTYLKREKTYIIFNWHISTMHPFFLSLCSQLEWFSFECRKTKTKVITLANHIGHRQYIEPIKTRSNYMWLTQSAGKSCERVTIGFGFTSDWMKRWRESFKPIASCRKCKTNYFSTLKWKPL